MEENVTVDRPPVNPSPAISDHLFENTELSNHVTEDAFDSSWGQAPSTEVETLEQERQGDLILNASKQLSSTHRYTYY